MKVDSKASIETSDGLSFLWYACRRAAMGTFAKQCSSWFAQLLVPMFIFTFIISGLLLNVVQIVFTGPLYFANRRLFRVLNAKIVYFHWCSKFDNEIIIVFRILKFLFALREETSKRV